MAAVQAAMLGNLPVHIAARRPVHTPDSRRGAHVAPGECAERSINGPGTPKEGARETFF